MDEDEQANSALAPRQKLLALASTVRTNLKEAPPPARDALVEYEAEVSRLLDGYERMAGEKESLAREKEKAHRRIVEWANAFKNKAKEVSQLEEELEAKSDSVRTLRNELRMAMVGGSAGSKASSGAATSGAPRAIRSVPPKGGAPAAPAAAAPAAAAPAAERPAARPAPAARSSPRPSPRSSPRPSPTRAPARAAPTVRAAAPAPAPAPAPAAPSPGSGGAPRKRSAIELMAAGFDRDRRAQRQAARKSPGGLDAVVGDDLEEDENGAQLNRRAGKSASGGKPRATKRPAAGEKRVRWTESEERALRLGVKKYGLGEWQKVLLDGGFHHKRTPARAAPPLPARHMACVASRCHVDAGRPQGQVAQHGVDRRRATAT